MRVRSTPWKWTAAWSKMARVGFGHPDDVAVDDAAHRDAGAGADLAHARAPEDLLDLARGVGHDAHRHPPLRQRPQGGERLGDRPPPQRRVAGVAEQGGRLLDVALVDPDRPDVRPVVLAPVLLLGALGRLDGHRRVVGAAVPVDLVRRAVVRQQRPEHGGVRQDQDPAGVEPDGVEPPEHRLSRGSGRPARCRSVSVELLERVRRGHLALGDLHQAGDLLVVQVGERLADEVLDRARRSSGRAS